MVAVLFLYSCKSNAIYFDPKSNVLFSCEHASLRNIYISDTTSQLIYRISWEEHSKTAPSKFSFNNIPSGYKVCSGWREVVIEKDALKVKPDNKYRIRNWGGDAAGFELDVQTDNTGKIVQSTPDDCAMH